MVEKTEQQALDAEEFLARTIERLRTGADWTYAELSQRMADAGCPIERSSLQKIERGRPRRKITVNELVAFSRVFRTSVPDLLISPSYRDDKMFFQDVKDGVSTAQKVLESENALREILDRVVESCLEPDKGPEREAALRKDYARLDELGSAVDAQGSAANRDPDPYGRGQYFPEYGISEYYIYTDAGHYKFLADVLERVESRRKQSGK
jgi:transcriptional regulator with XRE-family HTH domain